MTVRNKIYGAIVLLFATSWACQTSTERLQQERKGGADVPIRPREEHYPKSFAFGREITENEIAPLAINIAPDGTGLPAGKGTAKDGVLIYHQKCASCHGKAGEGRPYDRLVGDRNVKEKTIGNYWPYATTLFDYIRRAMPYNEPGSLTNMEVYQLTAYLLAANSLIADTLQINATTLPKVRMPNQYKFVRDDRQDGPVIR